ncbi:hypothetical protein BDN70DRAFT_548876 [Pholiota conissans]|uniref:F-box domain-containing protein n=1 Tax=Pholiota conissans TaxID=109636 RepID=A0A9P5Z6Y5_9AGAR|nr:hypothetical protein BDN70DRAFT_548876 [Pholiota conissans]
MVASNTSSLEVTWPATKAAASPLPPLPAASYSLDHIPTEIWQHIFSLLVVSEQHIVCEEMFRSVLGNDRYAPPSTSSCLLPRTPTTLSHVSVRWRSIAYGMPEIWSMLCVTAPCTPASDAGMRRLHRVGDLVTSWLARSASLPLKLSVVAKKNVRCAQTVLRSLLPACARWETLHVDVPFSALSILAELKQGNVPLLASVKMYERCYPPAAFIGQMASSNPSSVDKFHLCRISGSLRRLSVSSIPPTTPDGNAFCSHLQEVQIQESPSETWSTLRFLTACPQLRVLSLNGYGTTADLPALHNHAVTLPELEVLNLEHPFGRDWLLRMLTLPKLKSLYLGGRCSGDAAHILNEVRALMKRSALGSLECLCLELESHGLDHSILVDFLAANPLLHTLDIDDFGVFMDRPLVTTEMLEALTLSDARQNRSKPEQARAICPHLKFVSFENCSRFNEEALLRFLRSRSTHHRVNPTPRRGWVDAEQQNDCGMSVLESVEVSFKRRMQSAALEAWKRETFVMNGPSA